MNFHTSKNHKYGFVDKYRRSGCLLSISVVDRGKNKNCDLIVLSCTGSLLTPRRAVSLKKVFGTNIYLLLWQWLELLYKSSGLQESCSSFQSTPPCTAKMIICHLGQGE